MAFSSPIRSIAFDLSGIVMSDGLDAASAGIAREYSLQKSQVKEFLIGPPSEGYRTGTQPPEDFWSSFCKFFDRTDAKTAQRIFFDAYTLLPESVDFIARLPKQYETVLFSYSPPDRARHHAQRYAFERIFDRLLYGFDVRAPKTSAAAYLRLAELLGVKPGEVLMIDDKPEYAAAAAAAGMPAIVFRTFPQLAADLMANGVALGAEPCR